MPNDYFLDVYALVRLIPAGRVTSYGAIAKYLGSPSGARMVGWAMNASHTAVPSVPAHRVVNRLGMLSGKAHFENLTAMEQLLAAEGIQVIDNQIQDLERHFWNPMVELDLG